jgi:hypothetical protein
MDEQLACKTGLKRGLITKEVFDREIALCKNLCQDNDGKCSWGVCENCGVIPLLYKLHKGQLIEMPDELERIKDEVFKDLNILNDHEKSRQLTDKE